MAESPLMMGTDRANEFQTKIEEELTRRGYDAGAENDLELEVYDADSAISDQVMAEYIAIMVINNKTADQINIELSDLIGPDYDPNFSNWLFDAARPAAAPLKTDNADTTRQTSPASGQTRLVSQALGAVSGSKRAASPTSGGPNKARKVSEAPSAPRAMRDGEEGSPPRQSNGSAPAGKSLLERVSGPPQRIETFDSYNIRDLNDRGGGSRRGGFRGDNRFNRNGPPHQNRPQNPMPINNNNNAMIDPAFMAAMMDPSMMMGMNMPAVGLQDVLGSNLAMMQQMQQMMSLMQQQQQQQALNGSSTTASAPAIAAPTPLKPSAAPFVPTVTVPERPASPSLCTYGTKCTNLQCRYSHPSPVATPESGVVLSTDVCDKGPGGSECKDKDCTKSHLSPAIGHSTQKLVFGAAKPATKPATTAPAAASTTASKPPVLSAAPPQIPCKFGLSCTRPNCHFSHPPGHKLHSPAASGVVPCRFGAKCTRADCTFSHPPGRTLPNQFHRGLSSNTKVSEAYQPSPNRSVVFNNPKASAAKKPDTTPAPAVTPTAEQNKEEKAEEKEVENVVKEIAV